MVQLDSPDRESSAIHIVGQGVAGSVLALLLVEKGYKVHVYDNNYLSSSSMVAAGMWNPISFVNLKRSWLAHELLPVLERTYAHFENLLAANFFHPQRLLRIFPDAGAANLWEEKSSHPETEMFMEQINLLESEQHYHQPFGHGVVKGAGWLDLPEFLGAARKFLKDRNSYTQTEIDAKQILNWLQKGEWVFHCTGWKPLGEFWSGANVQANKGQVLTLHIDGMSEAYMSNFGKFLIPLGEGNFRVGSTYENGALDVNPSSAADEIVRHVKQSVKHGFCILDHKAGFRPATIDRFPLLGMHNEHRRLGIFNGMGSRGVMYAPFFAEHFIDHLTNGTPILKEVDWRRFERRR